MASQICFHIQSFLVFFIFHSDTCPEGVCGTVFRSNISLDRSAVPIENSQTARSRSKSSGAFDYRSIEEVVDDSFRKQISSVSMEPENKIAKLRKFSHSSVNLLQRHRRDMGWKPFEKFDEDFNGRPRFKSHYQTKNRFLSFIFN